MVTKLYTVAETAVILRESQYTTRERLRRGDIKGTKFGGSRSKWLITESALEHFIKKNTR
ncbi:helix-turn-helix domain-containing protein [Citricoccus sp. GCM10030269]|uniref:helix-turn-helix domain-containing protein n=1 Tax=Citricoccus sp. GCM10030269 TaxID=3273388 RepID=UPI00360D6EFD